MTRSQWRYVLLDQGAIATVFNILLNGGIAWALFQKLTAVPLWGLQSIGGDTLWTCFLLPCIACLIITPLARSDVRRGKLPALTPGPLLSKLPGSGRVRSLVFGLLATATIAPITMGVFHSLGIAELPFRDFVIFKALFAGGLAALIVPFIAAAAISDANRASLSSRNS